MMSRRLGAFVSMALLAVGLARAQGVRGDVLSVGFPAGVVAGAVMREGQWLPIMLRLASDAPEPLACRVELETTDLDGDRVRYVTEPPPLSATPRDVWVYVALRPGTPQPLQVNVVETSSGTQLLTLDVPLVEPMAAETQLIIDLSEPAVTMLQAAVTSSNPRGMDALGPNRRYYRHLLLSRLPAAQLPDRWIGLEAADTVVWDEPALQQISTTQQAALIQWVRSGGHLVLGLGQSWAQVRKSALAEILPVEGDGGSLQVQRLPNFFARFALDGETAFAKPIALANVTARRGQTTLLDQIDGPGGLPRSLPLVVTDQVGSGRVTVTTASMRDLASADLISNPHHRFLMHLIDLNPLPPQMLAAEQQAAWQLSASGYRQLYGPLIRPIEFLQTAGLLMGLAFLFVFVYIVAATGSWVWLRRYQMTQHSWSVFLGFALISSLASLGAVRLTQGCAQLNTVSLLDLEAGSNVAQGNVWLGYKSAARQVDDLSLRIDPNLGQGYLRGLAVGRLDTAEYATPARYTALSGRGRLDGVLMRATLKQFEGFWIGALPGLIRAQLTASRSDGLLTPTSWIVNDLPTPIAGGYVLYLDPRIRDETGAVRFKAAGATRAWTLPYRGAVEVPPSINVLAVRIDGPIAPGQRLDGIGREENARYLEALARWAALPDPQSRDRPEPITLWHRQLAEWVPSLPGLTQIVSAQIDQTIAAALLASTQNLYLHNRESGGFDSVGDLIGIDGLRDQDVSHWLTRNQAVLLLWSFSPSPAALQRGERELPATGGLTLYRVRAPLTYEGSPPRSARPGAAEAEEEPAAGVQP